ncbi:hypothetical protein V865_005848 [Kwoniella europaea PYCC6329]|uniref:INO80 complex subunit B-like conserved region domain-containing protein n=1 Tax=Kwoniella europaea PYCC6329 TaxID=1423913 RepID=A0AAX4KMQ7_9TREE
MAPKPTAIPTAARRAKRIIQSPSGSSSEASTPAATVNDPVPASDRSLRARNTLKRPVPPDDSEVEEVTSEEEEVVEVDEEEGEEEAEGDEDADGDVDMERSRLSSAVASEDIPLDDEDAEGEEEEEELEDSPSKSTSNASANASSSALKIKFKIGGGASSTNAAEKRPGRAAAKKSAKKVKKVAEDEFAESDDELLLFGEGADGDEDAEGSIISSRRSISPTKMTARQRAKGNKDLQETLLQLPNEVSGKKVILTEAERLQKREETARRRKRQTEQKLQDEQDETINRLLRAQTSKSRSKLDQPSPALGEGELTASGQASPSKQISSNMIRWSSTLTKDGDILLRVGAPKEKEDWISLTPAGEEGKDRLMVREIPTCGVVGCANKRIYRSTKNFDIGGCSLDHLEAVEKI